VAFGQNLPVPGHRLLHLDRHSLFLGVLQLDAVGAFEDVVVAAAAGEFLEVGLLLVGGDVEGVAELEADLFVLWRMIDGVFADELGTAGGILLVNSDGPLGQGQTEAGLFTVVELDEDADLELLPQLADAAGEGADASSY
jgi:hypothetical protein